MKLQIIEAKINRWQKTIDNSIYPRNKLVQQARDEEKQDCINVIRAILEDDRD